MDSLFTAEFFRGNRAQLKKLAKVDGPIVITANGQLQRSADSPLPFHQDSNFWYLTGINEPDLVLVIDKGENYLILPKRSDYQNIFSGLMKDSNLGRTSGVELIFSYQEGWEKLIQCLKKVKQVATVAAPPAYIKTHGMYTNPARAALIKKLKKSNPRLNFLDVREPLTAMRMIKQSPEIAALRKAVDMTCEAFKAVQKRVYCYEYELEADLTQLFRQAGADGHAYDPIVAGGKNACVLHYMKNSDPVNGGDLILVDAAAEYEHYAADITRVFSLKSKPSERQKQIYEAVKSVQEFAKELLKPRALLRDNEKKIEQFMGKKLQELGLIKTINSKAVRQYYPHSASHFLGLDVHDAGDYSQPLEANMVLTVEPGIYIKEEGIGVRIEDDILITKAGCEVLSRSLAHEL